MSKPKVLLFDIETAPNLGYVWGLWDNNVSLNMLYSEWSVLSWSAKWLDDSPSKIMYSDNRKAKDLSDDKRVLKGVWKLLDEADVVIGHNSKKFDVKKLNARFIINGMKPPSPYRQVDTLTIAKKQFSFTSNKLEYLTDKLCVKYKKLKHGKFPGFSLWDQCMKGNLQAWKEMEKYNKYDVLSLEELYKKLRVWDSTINFSVYDNDVKSNRKCQNCGSVHVLSKGYRYTNTGKFQTYVCKDCGSYTRSSINLLSKEKRVSLKVGK